MGERRNRWPPASPQNDQTEKQLKMLLEALEAIRKGDLTQRLTKETNDIFGDIANSYNGTVESLNTFSSELGCSV
jgi:methyl-accepting chemotaxis protein